MYEASCKQQTLAKKKEKKKGKKEEKTLKEFLKNYSGYFIKISLFNSSYISITITVCLIFSALTHLVTSC